MAAKSTLNTPHNAGRPSNWVSVTSWHHSPETPTVTRYFLHTSRIGMPGSFFLKFELTTWKIHPMQCKQHRRGKERSSTYQREIVSSDSACNSSWYELLRATVEVWVQGREQEERLGLQRPPNLPSKCNRRWQELQVRRIAWCLWEGLREDARNGGGEPLLLETRGHPSVFLALFQKWTPHLHHHSRTLPHRTLPAPEAFPR